MSIYKDSKEKLADDEFSFDAGFKIPESKVLLEDITDILQKEHKFETSEREKNGQSNKKVQKRGGTVCCCYEPNCRIGPFVEKR